MNTPTEKLAAVIAERLLNAKLLSRTEAKKILAKLAEGKMQPQDWRAAIETSAVRKSAR